MAGVTLARTEQLALRTLYTYGPGFSSELLRREPRLRRGTLVHDLQHLARRGLVTAEKFARRTRVGFVDESNYRLRFSATAAGQEWVAANPEGQGGHHTG